jgi:hypothetical protein
MSSWDEESRYRVYSRRADQAAELKLERERRQREQAAAKRARTWWSEVWESFHTADKANARDEYRVHPAVFGAPVPSVGGDLPLDWF